VKAAILDDLLTIGKQAGLKSFEQVVVSNVDVVSSQSTYQCKHSVD
jgi:hypothetical protein